MDFRFTEEQEILRNTVRRFLENECPREEVRRWDEEGIFPKDLYQKMADLGWFGLPFPERYGGSQCGVLDFMIVGEELARYSYEIAAGYGLCIFNALNIVEHGTEEQKEKYIPAVIKNKIRFAISITEPNAGSDAAALSSRAKLEGDSFVINGQKTFCSGANIENTIICMYLRTDPDLPKHKGISLILVENNLKGMEIRPIPTLGRRILPACEIFMDNVEVPKDHLVGEMNKGWKVLLSGLNFERLFTSAGYVGNAETVLNDALEHAKTREQFGRPIGSFQSIGHMLADMQTELDAARLLVYRAAWLMDQGLPCTKEVSIAKLFGSEFLVKATNLGMQIMGGYGYCMEYDMQRYLRDARIVTVSAGSSQIQRNIIAREMGLRVV